MTICESHGGRGYISEVTVWENGPHPDDWQGKTVLEYGLDFGEIMKASSTRKVLQFHAHLLNAYPKFRDPFGVGGQPRRLIPSYYLFHLQNAAFVQKDCDFEFSRETVEEAVSLFFENLQAEKVEATFIATLSSFQMEMDQISLPGGLEIRRLRQDEVRRIYTTDGTDAPKLFCAWGVSGSYERRVLFGRDADRQKTSPASYVKDHLCEPVLKAIWVHGHGRVEIGDIVFTAKPDFIHSLDGQTVNTERTREYLDFCLTQKTAPRLLKLVAAFQKRRDNSSKGRQLSVALDCLSRARVGADPRYSLLDAVTALEIMLLPKKESGVKMRFHLHYASLGRSTGERHDRRKRAARIYEIRSSITHGEALESIVVEGRQRSLMEVAEIATAMASELIERAVTDGSFRFFDQDWWYRQLLDYPDAK